MQTSLEKKFLNLKCLITSAHNTKTENTAGFWTLGIMSQYTCIVKSNINYHIHLRVSNKCMCNIKYLNSYNLSHPKPLNVYENKYDLFNSQYASIYTVYLSGRLFIM